ncbi:MAG: hypothetical protein H0W30_03725 [Gemmatimonadaceae bacterium]|nr:hypothetical protein [Gemmatimonadaceae bacterium]MDQ3517519.1 hypothetical protein [Gemmatimonadota bacterium]
MRSLTTLIDGVIDYAGLFPPASLAMTPAVRNFAEYRQGSEAWALGRFIVPALRLDEFERAAAALLPTGENAEPWTLSALAGEDVDSDLARIRTFNERHQDPALGASVIDSVELKSHSPAEIRRISELTSGDLIPFYEIPITSDPRPLIAAIGRADARAKVRTGGIIPDLIPRASDLVRFISVCAELGVPFKATAGLHHVILGSYPLTYEPDSASAIMFGFLNVFLCAAFLTAGASPEDAARLLVESDAKSFHFDDDGVTWRGHNLDSAQLSDARGFAISFGSCSFREPMDELQRLHPSDSRS